MQLLTFASGLVGLGGKLIANATRNTAQVQSQPVVSRDDAASAVAATDALARRQGGAADILNGTRGAEALSSSTGKLVLGN